MDSRYPFGGYSESQNLHSIKRHVFHPNLEVVRKPKACLQFGSQEGGLGIPREWLTGSAQKWGHMGPNRTDHLERQLRWTE